MYQAPYRGLNLATLHVAKFNAPLAIQGRAALRSVCSIIFGLCAPALRSAVPHRTAPHRTTVLPGF